MTEMKNKKMQNDVSFHCYINVIAKKSTTYAKFEKNSKNDQKKFFRRRRVKSIPQKYHHSMRLD